MDTYIGIDPSINGTAIYIIQGDAEYYYQIFPKSKEKMERLIELRDETLTFIDRYNGNVKVCAIEGYSFMSAGNAITKLAEWGGILRYTLQVDLGIDFIEVPPTTLKKFVSGKGTSKKELMILNLYKKYGREFESNDLADAYALVRYAQEWEAGNENNRHVKADPTRDSGDNN